MAYRHNTDNLFALILVLMISLITSPVFGMSAHHQADMVAPPMSSHHAMPPVTMTSENCHHPKQQLSAPQSDCCSETEMSLCSGCDSAHCQSYSHYLPIGTGSITNFPHDRLIPVLTSVQTVSRTETLFRPPIH